MTARGRRGCAALAAGSGRQRELGLRGVRGVRAMLGHTAQRGLGPGGVGERQGRVFSVRPSDRPSILPSSQLTPRSICSVPGVGDIKVNGAGKVPILKNLISKSGEER